MSSNPSIDRVSDRVRMASGYDDGPCSRSARANASSRNRTLPMRNSVIDGTYNVGE